jgi:nucleoid-associated protein YgaU
MRRQFSSARSLAPLVLGLCVWLLWPAQAFAAALIRFIHAVPGVGTATVDVNAGGVDQQVGSIRFGQVTPFKSVRAGSFRWTLKGGGKVLATGTSVVGNGVFDIAILYKPSGGVQLGIYRAAGGKPGTSLVRAIHAAPELGSPMFMLDSHTMADRLPYAHATPYFSIMPGSYSLSAMKPWLMQPGDPTLLDVKGVNFMPGAAYSVIAVGSRGQMVRLVRVVDRGAPLTRPVSLTNMVKPEPMTGSSMGSPGSVMVRPGDSLWSIASRMLGPSASGEEIHTKLMAVWTMNENQIGTDPNLIFPGQRLMLPA